MLIKLRPIPPTIVIAAAARSALRIPAKRNASRDRKKWALQLVRIPDKRQGAFRDLITPMLPLA